LSEDEVGEDSKENRGKDWVRQKCQEKGWERRSGWWRKKCG